MSVVNGMTEKLTQLKTAWESDLPKTIAKAPAEDLDNALVSLKQAREQHEAALKSIDMAIAQIEEKQKLVAKKRDKPSDKKHTGSGNSKGTKVGRPKAPAA